MGLGIRLWARAMVWGDWGRARARANETKVNGRGKGIGLGLCMWWVGLGSAGLEWAGMVVGGWVGVMLI